MKSGNHFHPSFLLSSLSIHYCILGAIYPSLTITGVGAPTADETGCLQNFFFLLLLTSEVSKGVNDHTKNQVKDDNNDDEEEKEVINHPGSKQGLLKQKCKTHIEYTCTSQRSR